MVDALIKFLNDYPYHIYLEDISMGTVSFAPIDRMMSAGLITYYGGLPILTDSGLESLKKSSAALEAI